MNGELRWKGAFGKPNAINEWEGNIVIGTERNRKIQTNGSYSFAILCTSVQVPCNVHSFPVVLKQTSVERNPNRKVL